MKIKKLEWTKDPFDRWIADGVCRYYTISHDLVPRRSTYDGEDDMSPCTTVEEAKAACQKQFEEEVMEYLEND